MCRDCMVSSHQNLPFHRMEAWNGRCFVPSSLFDQGFVLHVGHGGRVCPAHGEDVWEDIDDSGPLPTAADFVESPIEDIDPKVLTKVSVIIAVDTAGIFHHRVSWCTCHAKPDYPLMLFRHHLFPASFTRPETVFTFNVLDNFYMDSMECKTSANNFYNKLSRLTLNTFPHNVPVSSIILSNFKCSI